MSLVRLKFLWWRMTHSPLFPLVFLISLLVISLVLEKIGR